MFKAVLDLLGGAIVVSVSPPVSMDDGAQQSTNVVRTSIGSTSLFGTLNFTYANDQMTQSAVDTAVASTNPIDLSLARNHTLGYLIEELSQNLTLSFFSQPVFWSEPDQYYQTTLNTPQNINIYSYNARNLLVSYAVALVASLFAVFVGAWALWTNEASHSMSFSAVVRTTRNPTLDELVHSQDDGDECTGTLPINKSFAKAQLRLGVQSTGIDPGLRIGEGGLDRQRAVAHRHVMFGLREELEPLR